MRAETQRNSGTYRAYSDYRHALVRWIGRIPSHWTIAPVKRITESMCDGPFGSDMKSSHYSDEGVRLIRLQNIGMGAFDDSDRAYISEEHFLSLPGHDVIPGDVLVAGLGDANHPVGRACLFPAELGQAMVKADCFRLRVKWREVEPAFLVNFLCSMQAREGLTLATRGATRDRVNLTGIGQFALPLPPPAEQRQIARFLDRETSVIRSVVEKKERLIALLEEKRAALINRAVTRGLDPDGPMRNSSIPWLGSVPAHWRVMRLKRLAVEDEGIQMGPFGSMLSNISTSPTRFRLYGQENTISGDFEIGDRWITPEQYVSLGRYALLPGDIVLTRKGSIGKARLLAEIAPGIMDSDTIRVRVDRARIVPAFLVRLLHEVWYLHVQIDANSRGAILAGLNSTTIGDLQIALPPPVEQEAIGAFLDGTTAKINRAIAKIRQQIGRLQEYRTALISAAVTGKIDVRECSATEKLLT